MIIASLQNCNIHKVTAAELAEVVHSYLDKQRVLIITDEHVAKLHLDDLLANLIGLQVKVYTIEAGEKHKNLENISAIATYMIQAGYTRKTVIISFGGGMVSDLAGFLAGIYLRGVPFITIPTTVLAMLDASIGGKTAVNLPDAKNSLGMLNYPLAVVMQQGYLLTLPDREYTSAMGEAVKYAILSGESLFAWMENNYHELNKREASITSQMIDQCINYKVAVVQQDSKEVHDKRVLLNLGHTLGHALEQCTGYQSLQHGEAVAIGIVFAAYVSNLLLDLSMQQVKAIIKLLQNMALPVKIPAHINTFALLAGMHKDKKNTDDGINMVLFKCLGEARLVKQVPISTIKQAISLAKE